MSGSRLGGPTKSSVIDVPRGLYVLRYTRSTATKPPRVHLQSAPGHQAHLLSFLTHPDLPQAQLEQPGEAIAIASEGFAKLQITVEGRDRDGSTDAHLDLEPLAPASGAGAVISGVARQERFPAAVLSLLGHVSRRGDVLASSGEWLAGPLAPAPIEGVELRLAGAPAGWVECQVLASGERDWSPWRPTGTFLGTRGRARAIIGLRVRMNAASSGQILDGSALFLGSAIDRRQGRSLEFISPARRDPLIGLSLGLQNERNATADARVDPAERPPEAPRGKVRVFRAGHEV